MIFIFFFNFQEYASRVLQAALPKGGSSAGSARPLLANLQTLVEQSGMTAGTGLAGLGGVVGGVTAGSGSGGPRYTPGEICQVCGVLTTAEYCLETVLQLETKLKVHAVISYTRWTYNNHC